MATKGGSANSPGIQALLKAEKDAAELVKQARNRKTQRLKQAKDEADAEIESYRAQRDQEFKDRQQSNAGSAQDSTSQIQTDTKQKLAELDANVAAHRDEVINKLLEIVCQVEPRLHKNFKAA